MHREVCDWFGKTLSIETGRLAKQAHGAALVSLGDTVVLVTAVAAANAREGTDFVPLTVEYLERTYSAGRDSRRLLQAGGTPHRGGDP